MWVLPWKEFIVVVFETATSTIDCPCCCCSICCWKIITSPCFSAEGVSPGRWISNDSSGCLVSCTINSAQYDKVFAAYINMLWLHLNFVLSRNSNARIDIYCAWIARVVDNFDKVIAVSSVNNVKVWHGAVGVVLRVFSYLNHSHACHIKSSKITRVIESWIVDCPAASIWIAKIARPSGTTLFLENYPIITNVYHSVLVIEWLWSFTRHGLSALELRSFDDRIVFVCS